jgi:hypothetical protein
MRLLIAFSVFTMLLTAADQPAVKPKPAPKTVTSKPLQIPAEAVESEPGAWHYTDAQGKKWIYRKTPFGVARIEDKPDVRPEVQPANAGQIKATESGEYVVFERPGPFGTYKWQTRKSELNQEELAAWKRASAPKQD